MPYERQKPLPIEYKGVRLDCGYRIDLLVAEAVVVEIKAVSSLEPVHDAQLLTYMKLGGWKLGLLLNFNVSMMKQGIRRRIL
jgi:GxxExxY protein